MKCKKLCMNSKHIKMKAQKFRNLIRETSPFMLFHHNLAINIGSPLS